MKARRARVLSALFCAALLIAVAALAYFGGRDRYRLAQEFWWLRVTGYGALGCLGLALLASPAQRLWQWFGRPSPVAGTFVAWRRSFGITSAWLALGHAGLAMNTYLDWSWAIVWDAAHLRAGAAAALILLALLLTSFPRFVKAFRISFWKHLHRLAYVAAIFVFQHTLLSPFAPRRRILTIFGALLLVSLFRFIPRSKRRTMTPEKVPSSPERSKVDAEFT